MKSAALVAIATVAFGAVGGGCFLFHDEFPDRSCSSDLQCFRAQGERCNLTTRTCELTADAGPMIDARPVPDAAPIPDAATPADADITPDADPASIDADTTPDAGP